MRSGVGRTALLLATLATLAGGCATPAPAPPSESPVASPTASADAPPFACPIGPASLELPSNRIVGVRVEAHDGYDAVLFSLGESGAGSGATPTVGISSASPPFVKAPSGFPLEVAGDAFVRLTFRETVVADESGSATLVGPNRLVPDGAAVREVVEIEAFEGVADWIVGSRAPGCARVRLDPAIGTLTLEIRVP